MKLSDLINRSQPADPSSDDGNSNLGASHRIRLLDAIDDELVDMDSLVSILLHRLS